MDQLVSVEKFEFVSYDEDDESSLHGTEQLRNFLRATPILRDVDIIGVRTGYTNRVLRSIKKKNIIHADVIFPEGESQRKMNPFVRNNDIFETVKDICSEGICYFAAENANDIFSHINHMSDAEYCGMLMPETLMYVTWYKHKNKTILIGEMDCESG